jgi:hypothetical protein
VLKALPDVRLADPPRMADFARVLAAVDHVLGTSGVATYKSLAGDLAADAVASDSVLSAIRDTIREPWEGTAAELLAQLGDGTKGDKTWPKNARAMTTVLRRRAPSLRRLGWTVDDLGRQGKANAVRFLIEPPSDRNEASDRRATGERRERQASDSDSDARQVAPGLTCEDAEMASDASDASGNPSDLLLDQMNEEEEKDANTHTRQGLHSRRSRRPMWTSTRSGACSAQPATATPI